MEGSIQGEQRQGGFRGDPPRWLVLHTRSRQEKAVAADLAALQAEYFLPLVAQVRYYGRRKVRADLPLFPGYVFMHGSLDQAYQVDRAGRLANIIQVPDQQGLADELAQIRQALCVGAELRPDAYLRCGMQVEVRSGPFKGVRGVIESFGKRSRLILQIQALGQASSLEIDGSLLEPIEAEALAC